MFEALKIKKLRRKSCPSKIFKKDIIKGQEMKLTNAIKRLGKLTKVEKNGQFFYGEINSSLVEFAANGKIDEDTNITCIRVRRTNDNNDSMTDYFAGVWCDNLSQAIRLATA